MKIIDGFNKAKKLLDRQAPKDLEYKQEPAVRQIINDVRQRGDKALFELTEKFDGAKLDKLEISRRQITTAYKKVDKKLVDINKALFHIDSKVKEANARTMIDIDLNFDGLMSGIE